MCGLGRRIESLRGLMSTTEVVWSALEVAPCPFLQDRVLVDGGRTGVFEEDQASEPEGFSIAKETMTAFW